MICMWEASVQSPALHGTPSTKSEVDLEYSWVCTKTKQNAKEPKGSDELPEKSIKISKENNKYFSSLIPTRADILCIIFSKHQGLHKSLLIA